jgi:hypothetical protein
MTQGRGLPRQCKNPADFRLLHKAYPSDPYALIFRKDDPPFKALVDETLAKLMRSVAEKKLRSRQKIRRTANARCERLDRRGQSRGYLAEAFKAQR